MSLPSPYPSGGPGTLPSAYSPSPQLVRPPPAFEFAIDTTLISAGSSTATQFKLPTFNGGTYDLIVDWGDSIIEPITTWDQPEVTHTYAVAGIYTIKITGTFTGLDFDDILKILDVLEFGPLRMLNADKGFADCFNVELANARDVFNTEGLTTLSNKFFRCRAVTGGYANINAEQIVAMSRTFIENKVLIETPNFSVPNLSIMDETYRGCLLFDADVSNYTTSKVFTFDRTFQDCSEFTGRGLPTWDMSSATTIARMLLATKANQNLGAWNLEKLTDGTNFLFDTTDLSVENFDLSFSGWMQPIKPAAFWDILSFSDNGAGGTTVTTVAPLPSQIVDNLRVEQAGTGKVEFNGSFLDIFNVVNSTGGATPRGKYDISVAFGVGGTGGTGNFDGVVLRPFVTMHMGGNKYGPVGAAAIAYAVDKFVWNVISAGPA